MRYIVFTLLFTSSIVRSQTIIDDFVSDVKQSVSLGIDYFNVPARFDNDDWLTTGAVIVPTVLMMPLDKRVKENMLSIEHTHPLDNIMNVFRSFGEVYYIVPAAGLTYTAGLLSRSDDLRRIGRELVQSLLYSGIVTTAVKSIFGRVRPNSTESAYDYRPFRFIEPYQSLPSGHSTAVFAVASVLAAESENIFVQSALYLAAAGTAVSRLYQNQHWASDVFLGAVIGTTTGVFVVNKNKQTETSSLMITPGLGSLNVTYHF